VGDNQDNWFQDIARSYPTPLTSDVKLGGFLIASPNNTATLLPGDLASRPTPLLAPPPVPLQQLPKNTKESIETTYGPL